MSFSLSSDFEMNKKKITNRLPVQPSFSSNFISTMRVVKYLQLLLRFYFYFYFATASELSRNVHTFCTNFLCEICGREKRPACGKFIAVLRWWRMGERHAKARKTLRTNIFRFSIGLIWTRPGPICYRNSNLRRSRLRHNGEFLSPLSALIFPWNLRLNFLIFVRWK